MEDLGQIFSLFADVQTGNIAADSCHVCRVRRVSYGIIVHHHFVLRILTLPYCIHEDIDGTFFVVVSWHRLAIQYRYPQTYGASWCGTSLEHCNFAVCFCLTIDVRGRRLIGDVKRGLTWLTWKDVVGGDVDEEDLVFGAEGR